ncbi:MAG: hypothetical protein QNK27_02670, partial [Desulfuromusa sp.]|nr:hypothetical protein [Desulfuromusa sp.]
MKFGQIWPEDEMQGGHVICLQLLCPPHEQDVRIFYSSDTEIIISTSSIRRSSIRRTRNRRLP